MIGVGIDTSDAKKLREELLKFIVESRDSVAKEIAVEATQEKVKQIHGVVGKWRDEMRRDAVTHL